MKKLSLIALFVFLVIGKINAQGPDMLWTKSYGGEGEDWIGASVLQTEDNGFIMTGWYSGENDADVWLLKTDANGNEQWTSIIEGAAGMCLNQLESGEIIIGGLSGSPSGNIDLFLALFDEGSSAANQAIDLNTGYQFRSSYIIPAEPDLMILLQDLMDDETLEFVRNSEGSVLQKIGPNWVNNICNLIPGEGYLVKMTGDDQLIY